jgi:hypothetical protein
MEFTNYDKLTDTGVDYEPEFGENRELPEENRMVFTLRPMTNKLRGIYDKLQKHKFVGKKTEQELQTNTHFVQEKIFAASVLRTQNVVIIDPLTREKNANPPVELLYDALPPELTMELLAAIDNYSVLEKGIKKQ